MTRGDPWWRLRGIWPAWLLPAARWALAILTGLLVAPWLLWALVLVCGVLTSVVSASGEVLTPINFGAQWAWTESGRPSNHCTLGWNCLYFEAETQVDHVSWLSALKIEGEILFQFMIYTPATGALTALPSTLHEGRSVLVRTYPGFTVPAGSYIGGWWNGGGAAHPWPVEVQVTLWLR